VNVFELIADILAQPRNNPVQQFDKYSDIEAWLREQWSGMFRELIQRMQNQTQISTLQAQVDQLSELNTTLKNYLEEIMSHVAPKESKALITHERKRLEEAEIVREIQRITLGRWLISQGVDINVIRSAAESADSFDDFVNRITKGPNENLAELMDSVAPAMHYDLNRMRRAAAMPPIPLRSEKHHEQEPINEESHHAPSRRRARTKERTADSE
jgi:prefoldin subunit 5